MTCKMRRIAGLALAVWFALSPCYAYDGADTVGFVAQAPKSLESERVLCEESSLGSAAADAVRETLSADLALVNSGDLQSDLLQGTVTWDEIRNVFSEDRPLVLTEVTPARLREWLECSVSRIQVDSKTEQVLWEESEFSGFLQIAGFSFGYDATAPVGDRILWIKLEDGTRLALDDGTTPLRVGMTDHMAGGGYGYQTADAEATGETLASALAAYVSQHDELRPEQGRIQMIGARSDRLIGGIRPGVMAAGSGVLILLALLTGQKLKHDQAD